MRNPQPLPSDLNRAPFTFGEAVEAGVSIRRLRYRGLGSPGRGLRSPGTLLDFELPLQVRPYTVVTAFSAASHATAFLLWDFPGFLPGSDDPRIHISRPDTMAIPRRRGVAGHVGQFFDDEITSLDGVLITSRARTWLDVSRKMSIDELTVAADHLLRVPRPGFEGREAPMPPPSNWPTCWTGTRGHPAFRRPGSHSSRRE
ncbi:hypothetical protein [Arthrobacter sp. 92]|uniref:hypothetical protein n=1 Tax=Arthrobacter sp. 92 TaxID=3418175 RepID=UPI003D07FABC